MTYRALHPGKVTQLNASTGDYVPKGHVIARVMWFDEPGKSGTEGTSSGVAAPFDGTVEFFVSLNSHFQKGEPLFRIDPDTPKGRIAPAEDLRSILESGIAAALQNDWQDTQRKCQQVLDAHPTEPSMEFIALKYRALALGFVGYQTGDRAQLEEALIEGRLAVSVFQRTSEPQQNSAGAYKAVGNAIGFMIAKGVIRSDEWATLFPEGIAALKKAIELDPEDAQARKHLGIMYSAEPVAKMQGAKTKSGGCFIATAACGDPFVPEVIVLSDFRDDVLLRSRIGAAFVRLYYAISPPIASMVVRSHLLRKAVMTLLVQPAVRLVSVIRRTTA